MELLVVILIMGILMGMVIGLWKLVAGKGREARAKAEMQEIARVISDYQAKYGVVPENNGRELIGLQGDSSKHGKVLDELRKVLPTNDRLNEGAPTRSEALQDPWYRPYMYRTANQRQSFILYSRGKLEHDAGDDIHSDRID